MDKLEPSGLYDELGEVSRYRPLLQGDIFSGVDLPELGPEPYLVQVVAHPCAMRKGHDLLSHITVAPVAKSGPVGSWNGSLRIMPLPSLVDGDHYATQFVSVTAARADKLRIEKRIASLSHRGIYVLQQRLIKHYTRLEVGLVELHKQSAPTLEEASLQFDWVETCLRAVQAPSGAQINAAIKSFDDWLRQGSPSPQELLKEEVNFVDVRRAARIAVGKLGSRPR
ncbi:hypothetical protein QKG88_07310 [Clavibacter michiganensis]|uniref:hypothetical protein n=2 Tax=Clavibacter michiganensis TaxID=28447 RepID=UPI00117F4A39|nr:hypothetical protein [Clavibacter michiganensis]MDO4099012.1 hypothetical protein [Clavibacter michiganensis]MDO4127639.1 hypothetical protein [Clavibacter michiganensis]